MFNQTEIMNTVQLPRSRSRFSLAYDDIIAGFKNWRFWFFLSWQDIRLQYRRSALGPLWITLSMAVTVYSMGFLYGKLFKIDLKSYYPFIATGMLSWSLISTLVIDGTNIFIDSENFIKQMKQPYSTYVLRSIMRTFLIFLHNIVVLVPIFLVFGIKINLSFLFFPVALFILFLNGFSYGLILSIFSTRFRDLKPIITSFMQVVFFVTPVIWSSKILIKKNEFVTKLNPFAQILDFIREPLLGNMPSLYALNMVFGITVFGLIASFYIFSLYRARISYWL